MLHKILMTLLCIASISSASPDKKPNIIFFIADDMLPKHFNCLPQGEGKNLTPNIDRLAAEGILMEEQYCASPICTPSRYNVLTGTYASRAQNSGFKWMTQEKGQTVVEFNTHIIKGQTSLPALLKDGGYSTGMSGKNHVVESHGRKKIKDFDASARDPEIVATLKANHDHVCQAMREIGFDYVDRVYDNNPDFLGLHEIAVQNMDWITEGGVNFLKQKRDNPFFLYMATTVPHGPTAAKRSWNADPLLSPLGWLDEAPNVQPARHTIPTRLKEAGLPVNDDTANMLWLDDALGALINTLEETDQLDNTLIFFYSDHGQMAKGTLYQGGIHNPCIIWKKGGFKAGSKSKALTHIVDFAPTILDIAGISYTADTFDGISFLPALDGGALDEERVMYFELGYARAVRKGNFKYLALRYPESVKNMSLEERRQALDEWNMERRRKHLNIVTENHSDPFSHLTAVPGGGDAEKRSTGDRPSYYDRDQLYDLSKDRREQRNLANDPEYATVLKDMKQELDHYVTDLPGSFGEFGQGE